MLHVSDFIGYDADMPVVAWLSGIEDPNMSALEIREGTYAYIKPYGFLRRLDGTEPPEEELGAVEGVGVGRAKELVANADWRRCLFLELKQMEQGG